jgi:hypothetical protein
MEGGGGFERRWYRVGFFFFFFFFKGLVALATLFVYFLFFSYNTVHTSFIHPFAEGPLLFLHCSSLSRGPPWGAEPGFELGPAGIRTRANRDSNSGQPGFELGPTGIRTRFLMEVVHIG